MGRQEEKGRIAKSHVYKLGHQVFPNLAINLLYVAVDILAEAGTVKSHEEWQNLTFIGCAEAKQRRR